MLWRALSCSLFLLLPLQAQYAVGGGMRAELNFHTGGFRSLAPDIPSCCPGFSSTTGFGWGIMATYDGLRLAPRLRLLLEGGYQRHEASFVEQEPTTVATPDGGSAAGTFEYELRTRLELLTTHLLLGYAPIEELPQWQLRLGMQARWTLATSFSQRERLVEPPYGHFSDTGTRIRNEYSGRIPNSAPLTLALGIGTRYLLPLAPRQRLALQPCLMGWFALTRLVRGIPWRTHALEFSLSLVYAPFELPSPLQPGVQQ